MVLAALEDRKTNTRRICREALMLPSGGEQRARLKKHPNASEWASAIHPARESGWIAWAPNDPGLDFTKQNYLYGFPCPYGKPGDRLWVRESFAVQPFLWERDHGPQPVEYLASITDRRQIEDYVGKPSIHMPRWASRITLEILNTRVERVQAITEADAKAEGVETSATRDDDGLRTETTYTDEFSWLWDSLNSDRGFGWSVNPWVWVIEFKRITP